MDKKYFTRIPNSLVRKADLANGPFRILCYLLSYKYGENGKVFVSQKTIANNLNIDVKTVKNNLDKLKNLNLIDWKKRGFSKSNLYDFNIEKYFHIDCKRENKSTSIQKFSSKICSKKVPTNKTSNNNLFKKTGIERAREVANSLRGQKLDNIET